jgi:hypothetical protein
MSKASAVPPIVKQLVKSNLQPKARLHKTQRRHVNFIPNPHLGQKIRFHDVAKNTPGSPVLSGKNRGFATVERAPAKFENLLKGEKSSQTPETDVVKSEAEGRTLSRDQKQPSQPPVPRAISGNPEAKGALKAVAVSFEAPKRTPGARNYRNTATANMSSQLTKVLAKDACPRK